ncbi:hypothetical protein [Streptomyces sp. NBC_00211]|uniref:hypothetical protein n=1 Tax=Streptomyces sp. NBC_00211 TaxID=2975683 RepID=UPI003245FF10
MADLMSILQLLGAGSVGGVVSQYVTAAPDRRKARATAREAMAELERKRWASGGDGERRELRDAAHAFESATMISGLPREVAQWYVRVITASYNESLRSWKEQPLPEFGGGVPVVYMDAFAGAADLVQFVLWHPQRSKLTWRRRLKRSQAAVAEATADSPLVQRDLARASGSV